MLWVELAEHGGDAAAGDGLAAAGAGRSSHLVVVVLAVGEALMLEKVAIRKRALALPANGEKTNWLKFSIGSPLPAQGAPCNSEYSQ